MLRSLTLLTLLSFLLSCGDSTPDAKTTVTMETEPTKETALTVEIDAPAAAPTMPKDQIKQTVKAEPEVINAAKLLEGAPQPTASIKGRTVTPSQPAPKATKPAAVTAPASPAPSAPVSAPAPAPKKETAPVAPPVAPTPAAVRTEPVTAAPTAPPAPAKPDHAAFNGLLGKHVNSRGDVNYAAFKKDEAKLDAYIAELSQNSPGSDWSRKESMAFWINAYNANTIKLILKNYPLKSITNLHGGKPWDMKWIKIDGKTYSLNNIEHDIIRPRYKDARIHFAVNCAAASCPPLPNKAFTPANLNSLLESRTRSFIRNAKYNTIADGQVEVSKIFDWYGEDFGDLRVYLNKYTSTEIAEGTEIGFVEYDWALNKQ